MRRLAEAAGAAVVLSPGSTGVLPDAHAQNMHVGGSKGSISGNYAMAEGRACDRDRLARGVPGRLLRHRLQDREGRHQHQRRSRRRHPLQQHAGARRRHLGGRRRGLRRSSRPAKATANKRDWLDACAAKKAEWAAYKRARFEAAPIRDEVWQRPALTQPAAIKIVADFAKEIGAAKFFDAGDVQANGFQIVEDDRTGDTFTETGASYMGFAASALLASALADKPRYGIAFCGDGSFMMNPQILIDGVEHGVRGMIVIFDNRRMAAITGLQMAQYGAGVPHQRQGRGRLRAARRRGRAACTRSTAAGAPRSCKRALRSRARPRRPLGRARAGLFRRPTSSAGSAPGASGTSATGARTCSATGSSRIS